MNPHDSVVNTAVVEDSPKRVVDPVCGMKILLGKAAGSQEYEDQTYYFCSQSCVQKFKADPARYVAREAEQRPASSVANGLEYICPMDPEVHKIGPGVCPKCGMALEPAMVGAPVTRTEYTCPMHPQIVRPEPGNCPICGMTLEPREITADEKNPELVDMTRRFWISVGLAVPMLVLMVSELLPSMPLQHLVSATVWAWVEFALATPVVLWCGWLFFVRGWQSVVNRSLNMFTLIALGTGTAYLYSLAATFTPQLFPPSFRSSDGQIAVYFEPAAVIIALVLLGQVMELRPRPNKQCDPCAARPSSQDGEARGQGRKRSGRGGQPGGGRGPAPGKAG